MVLTLNISNYWSNIIYNLKYKRSTISGCKDKGIVPTNWTYKLMLGLFCNLIFLLLKIKKKNTSKRTFR